MPCTQGLQGDMHLCKVHMASTVGPSSSAGGQGWMPRVAAGWGMLIVMMPGVHQLRLGIVLRRC